MKNFRLEILQELLEFKERSFKFVRSFECSVSQVYLVYRDCRCRFCLCMLFHLPLMTPSPYVTLFKTCMVHSIWVLD